MRFSSGSKVLLLYVESVPGLRVKARKNTLLSEKTPCFFRKQRAFSCFFRKQRVLFRAFIRRPGTLSTALPKSQPPSTRSSLF